MRDATEKRKRQTWAKEILTENLEDAAARLDDMAGSRFDIYIVLVETSDEIDGYIRMRVLGWENEETRDIYSV